MRSSNVKSFSLIITSSLVALVFAACGRASAPKYGTTTAPASATTLPVAALQTTVNEFSIAQTDSQVTVNQMKIGSTGIGKIEFTGTATVQSKNYDFDLKGEIGKDGMAILRPDDKTLPLRARVFCLDNGDQAAQACDQYFVDVYFRQSADKFLHVQLVRHSDFSTTPDSITPAPVVTAPLTPVAPAKPAAPPTAKPPVAQPAPVAPAKPAPAKPAPAKPAPPVTPPVVAPAPPVKAAAPAPTQPVPQKPKKVEPKPIRPTAPPSSSVKAPVTAPAATADTGTTTATEEAETDDAPAPDGAYEGLPDVPKIQELFEDAPPSDDTSDSVLEPDMSGEPAGHPTDQAVGTYDNGHLERASALDVDAKNYFIPQPDTKRYYGAYVAIHFIELLANHIIGELPGFRLRVDDIAQQHGGEMFLSSGARYKSGPHKGERIPAHASHEIGLDADIGYLMDVPYTSVPLAVAGGKMSSHMRKPVQWEVFKSARRSALISTIFVDPAVKRGFCSYAKSIGEDRTEAATLTMLRPLDSHTTHFHLRFVCTKFNPRCRNEKVAGRPLGC